MTLNEAYEKLTEAQEFIKNFRDDRDFIDWLKSGNISDLKCALKVFENAEMYEQCAQIRDVIKWKQTNK